MDKISCPKCNSTDLYRYGKEKHIGLNGSTYTYTYAFLYNFKRVHSHLNSTPAQCLGVEINAYNPYTEVFLKCLI